MTRNFAKACLYALLLSCVTSTDACATVIRAEEFYPFLCGPGGTVVEVVSLPTNQAQFGIAQTSSAISVKTPANTNAVAGYEALINLSGYTRGGVDSDLKDVTIYFNPIKGAPRNLVTAVIDFRAKGRGSQRHQSIVAQVKLDASSAGVGGWRVARVWIGSAPFDVGELRLRVIAQNDSNKDQTIKFGKIELSSTNEVLRDNNSALILQTRNCAAQY